MPRKTVRRSLLDFLIWWTITQGKRRIASHEIQGLAVRWIKRDREKTVTPATVNREWRRLREDGKVVASLVTKNDGAEDVWNLKSVDGQNVDTLLDSHDRQMSMFD